MNIYSAPTADFTHIDNQDATYEPSMFALKGRIGRVRYIAYYAVLAILTSILALLLIALLPKNAFVALIAYLPVLAVSFIVTVRRLHDMDQNGWLAIMILIPLVNFFFWLWLVFGRGTDGDNRYGTPPSANNRALVVLACILPAIVVIGILAAIAIPAYSDYTKKAKAARGAALTTPAQVAAYSAPLSLMSM